MTDRAKVYLQALGLAVALFISSALFGGEPLGTWLDAALYLCVGFFFARLLLTRSYARPA